MCKSVFLCFLSVFSLIFINNNEISPCYVKYNSLDISPCSAISNEVLISKVNALFSSPNYRLIFANLEECNGKFDPLSNTIYISNHISQLQLPAVLAHELVHKTLRTKNEKTTITHSLRILLESNDTYLINSAKFEISLHLNGCYDHNANYTIKNYLQKIEKAQIAS